MIVSIEKGNLLESISKYKLDCIMNAANGTGPMGRGIAGAIRKYGGDEIMHDAFNVCADIDPQAGDSYITISGKLKEQGIKCIIHAVTMKKPGGYTDYEIVENCFSDALDLVASMNEVWSNGEKVKRVGCTALATGVGNLDPKKVANIMFRIAEYHELEICFMDFDEIFINELIRLENKK